MRPDEPVLIAYFWVCLTFELAASAFVKPLESRPVCAEEEMMSDRVGPRAAAWGAEMGERVPKSAHVCGMIRRFRVSQSLLSLAMVLFGAPVVGTWLAQPALAFPTSRLKAHVSPLKMVERSRNPQHRQGSSQPPSSSTTIMRVRPRLPEF